MTMDEYYAECACVEDAHEEGRLTLEEARAMLDALRAKLVAATLDIPEFPQPEH